MQPSWFTHIIPQAELWAEYNAMMAAMIAGGYDPQELDFSYPIAQKKLRDLRDEALACGIEITLDNWVINAVGDLEVVFGFANDAEMIVFKLAIT